MFRFGGSALMLLDLRRWRWAQMEPENSWKSYRPEKLSGCSFVLFAYWAKSSKTCSRSVRLMAARVEITPFFTRIGAAAANYDETGGKVQE